MKFGFEKEFFVKRGEKYVLADQLPHDDCGFLAEARGEPHSDPIKAAALLEVEIRQLRDTADRQALILTNDDYVKLPRDLRNKAIRRFGKNAITEQTGAMYGKFMSSGYQRAGLHVHFSDEQDGKSYKVAGLLDIPRFVFGMDRLFTKEIKAAKRVPGLYEMKPYGFEYRSLPASINVERVAKAITLLLVQRWDSDMTV